MQYLLDPTGELDPITQKPLRKLKQLKHDSWPDDISKAKGDVFLDRIENFS